MSKNKSRLLSIKIEIAKIVGEPLRVAAIVDGEVVYFDKYPMTDSIMRIFKEELKDLLMSLDVNAEAVGSISRHRLDRFFKEFLT